MLVSAKAFFVHQQNTLECIHIVKQKRASWDRFQCVDTLWIIIRFSRSGGCTFIKNTWPDTLRRCRWY